MFADLWNPCLSPKPVSFLFISPQNLYSLEWKLLVRGKTRRRTDRFNRQEWLIGRNRRQRFQEILGNKEWSDSPDKLKVLGSTTGDTWQQTQKVTSPDGSKVLWQYIGSTWQQKVQPGDCCSPAQVQDQQSSVQNQQDPTKDLADEIRTYWNKMQM